MEVKDVIRRITNYVIDSGGDIKLFSGGKDWNITTNKKEYINQYNVDNLSQLRLTIEITEP